MWKQLLLILLAGVGILASCGDNGTPPLEEEFEVVGLRIQLPEGWESASRELRLDGGYGYASPEYAGFTYLRLHQGAMFSVLTAWDRSEDASTILETAFAENISEPQPIEVLGTQGTYAHGTIDQGQGIGAVHVILEEDGEETQYAFLSTVANYWENFEPTFLKVIENIEYKQ